jgi:hypothetical protein
MNCFAMSSSPDSVTSEKLKTPDLIARRGAAENDNSLAAINLALSLDALLHLNVSRQRNAAEYCRFYGGVAKADDKR